MAKETTLLAEPRNANGSGAARRLRHVGQVPAIVYNHQRETLPIQIDAHVFGMLLAHHGESMVLRLTVAGIGDKTVLLKDVQHDPISGGLLHADFMEISLTEKLEAPVAIELVGEAAGVKLGGVLEQQLDEVDVECLPMDLPESIVVDVAALNIGNHLTVAELTVPDGVVVITEANLVIASVLAPRMAEETSTEEAAAGGGEAEPALVGKKPGEEAKA
jgi:large subunit ribosomal protein L25